MIYAIGFNLLFIGILLVLHFKLRKRTRELMLDILHIQRGRMEDRKLVFDLLGIITEVEAQNNQKIEILTQTRRSNGRVN